MGLVIHHLSIVLGQGQRLLKITELTPKDIQQIKYLLASMKLVPSFKRILSTRSRHPGSHGIMLTCQLANFRYLLAFEFVYTIYTCIYMLLSNGAHNDSKQEPGITLNFQALFHSLCASIYSIGIGDTSCIF